MNILLITSSRNNDKSATWVVLSKFIRQMRDKWNAKIQIICLSPLFYNKGGELGEKTYNTFLANGKIVSVLRRINNKYLWLISKFYSKIYTPKIVSHIEKYNINKLWVVADIQSLLVLNEILKKKKISYHISVFDDIFFNQSYTSFKDNIDIFKYIFHNSKSIDTPTSNLYEFYRENKIINNKTRTTDSFVGVFKNIAPPPTIKHKVKKIVLSGSIYGIDALVSFISAIEEIMLNENIEFYYMTKTFDLHLKYLKTRYEEIFKYIKITPFIPEEKLVSELQNYDLLYLPMKFDKQHRFQTNTSFPSKSHNYLASQIPIIVHAPNSSALYNFFTENEVGYLIDSLNPQVIKSEFKMLLDKKIRENLSYKIRVSNKKLMQNNHIDKLYNLINEDA